MDVPTFTSFLLRVFCITRSTGFPAFGWPLAALFTVHARPSVSSGASPPAAPQTWGHGEAPVGQSGPAGERTGFVLGQTVQELPALSAGIRPRWARAGFINTAALPTSATSQQDRIYVRAGSCPFSYPLPWEPSPSASGRKGGVGGIEDGRKDRFSCLLVRASCEFR